MAIEIFSPLPPLSFFLLDFDGVVADTESVFDSYDGAVLNAFLKRGGSAKVLNRAEVRALAGIPFEEKLETVARQCGFDATPFMDDFIARRRDGRPELFRDAAIAYAPNLRPFLEKVAGRTALVTNKDREKLDWDLAAMDLAELFPVCVCLSPEFRRKPAPDLLLEGMSRIGAIPAQTAYVGDNTLDMEAALAAGVTPLGFLIEGLAGRAERARVLRAAGAAAVMDDFGDIPVF